LYRPFGCQEGYDWEVNQLPDPFRTTHKVKTQQVVKNRGQHCDNIELAGYLASTADPVSLVLDLRIVHDRVDSSTDPALNGHLRYPNNVDQSLYDTTAEFYSYRLIGKLTAFLQLQEFCQRNQTVDFSTTTGRFFLLCSNLGLEIFSPWMKVYVLNSTLTDRQSSLTLTLHTRKLLVYQPRLCL
jgi:hypothetical protein